MEHSQVNPDVICKVYDIMCALEAMGKSNKLSIITHISSSTFFYLGPFDRSGEFLCLDENTTVDDVDEFYERCSGKMADNTSKRRMIRIEELKRELAELEA